MCIRDRLISTSSASPCISLVPICMPSAPFLLSAASRQALRRSSWESVALEDVTRTAAGVD
eukprot:3139715-Pyramimonas_sp.AAC.1